jgi:hypothetical protein
MPKAKKAVLKGAARPKKALPDAGGITIGKSANGEAVALPFGTLVLHGMVGGSTGTGKTRMIQVMAEKLVEAGVPVLLADLKGDISGFIKPNGSDSAIGRANEMGLDYSPRGFPMASFSISDRFIPLRLELDNIDATLLARIMKLNPTQESNLKIAFLYAKGKGMPVRDLLDLQAVLAFLAKNPDTVPGASSSSIEVILRQISIAVGEGLNGLFGEPELDVDDLLIPRVNAINLSDWRRSYDLPSILMSFILFRLFHELPDVGSLDKPKLAIFIDEAHYLFQDANPSLVSLFVTILKQIRSKGVAVFLCSQNPEDIPEKVLEQLGCKVEFALRAFTSGEMRDVAGIARAFPPTKKFDIAREILALRIGEAVVSPLGADGRPLEPVKTVIEPPRSSMGVSSDAEIRGELDATLLEKYREKTELERYDLSGPFEGFKLRRRDGWSAANAEAQKYERKQARQVSKNWSRWKMAGLFVLAALFLLIVIVIAVTVALLLLK